MSKLRIGVFGGARGNAMIQILLNHPEAQLVAVCDKYETLLKTAKKNAEKAGLEIKCFTDFEDFIRYDMDAVVLANYATEHATFAIRCLNAGKHVMSELLPTSGYPEKPLTEEEAKANLHKWLTMHKGE